MNIYSLLPRELHNKIKYFVLEHPVAKIIKDDIERLRCDEYYVFEDKNGKIVCKVDGRDFTPPSISENSRTGNMTLIATRLVNT